MLRLARLCLVTVSVAWPQSYSGYLTPAGSGSTPTISFQAKGVLTCASGSTADAVDYPAGCYVSSSAGTFLLGIGKNWTAPSAGNSTLFCQGQAYLACTLTVNNPNSSHPSPPVPPKPQPTDGGYYLNLGGPNHHPDACNIRGLSFRAPPVITAGQPASMTVSLANMGGGFCSTTSSGFVSWGDPESPNAFPQVQAPPNDACAAAGTLRLAPGPYSFTHTYYVPGPYRIFAWAQGDFKDNGDPGGHTKLDLGNAGLGNSGSWRCHQQMWQDVTVIAPAAAHAAARVCQVKQQKTKCLSR